MLTGKAILSRVFMIGALPYLFLCACDTKEQKQQNALWEQQAAVNAQDYIRNKYGFTANVTGAGVDREDGMFGGAPRSDVIVDMEYDGRAFQVFITGETTSAEGADTWQIEMIEKVFCDYLHSNFDGIEKIVLQPRTVAKRERNISFSPVYFDGSNLMEAALSCYSGITAYCLHTDLSQESDFAFLAEYCQDDSGIEAEFISCRTAEAMGNSSEAHQPICCESIRQINSRGETYQAYELQTIDGYPCYIAPEQNGLVTIEKTEAPDPAEFGYGWEIDSEALRITANSQTNITVYVPLEEIGHFDANGHLHSGTMIGHYYKDRRGEKHYYKDFCHAAGGYAIIQAHPSAEAENVYVFLREHTNN
ncbi:MAG: hypothetical protein MJ065_08980 [Oscillospiraceae bacterium]|nr:hypothetical protein [Oscillospiraceae bacterium]